MSYCDYYFYKTEYMGNVVAEADFPRLVQRASDKLDIMTFDRLDGGLPEDIRLAKKVKKAICAMVDRLADYEIAEATVRANGGYGIASVSSGSESVSYRTDATTKTDRDKELYYIAKEYLAGTGLLYAGF